ncbi:MAG TPA: hypothetical protein VFG76_11135 [Candidatus Polarisedimenticolia bacterium]|nr:hypothetical protein [Candidatus Polarisedimenticolia bacterium]
MSNMKETLGGRWILALALAGAVGTFPVLAAGRADAAYEKIKGLAGEWEGKAPDGSPVNVRFELVSGGHTVMEHTSVGDMITMYHLDGDRLVLTHYCEGNNQPRMRAEGLSADGSSVQFKFLDATNLAKPADPHMHGLTVTFKDNDHISEKWTHSAAGKEGIMDIALARKK